MAPRKATVFSLVLFFTVPAAPAQILRGFVSDQATGEPLESVNVSLVDSTGALYGAATNTDGLYLVPRLQPGRYVVRFAYIGYHTHVDTLDFAIGQTRILDIFLEEDTQQLQELVIEGVREGSVTDMGAGMERIEPAAIERMPAPDVSGDLATYLTTLPGVVLVGDQGGQFYVRGGEPTQNLVLLDGMLVYQPFHILSYYSAFPAEILRTVDLHAGGFGARFGGRISSVIDAWSRNGNNQQFAASGSISPFLAGTQLEGPLVPSGRVSMLASVRESVVEHAGSRVIGREVPLHFRDIFAKVHGRTNEHGRLSFSGLRTYDRGRVGSNTGRGVPEEVRWHNEAIGGRYLYLPGNLPIHAEFMVSYSQHTMELGLQEDPLRTSSTARANMEGHVVHYSRRGDMRWGGFLRTLILKSELSGLYQDFELSTEYVTEAGMYAAPVYRISRRTSIMPSIRLHHFPSKNRLFAEPRMRLEWGRGPHDVSMAAGLYHQEIIGINDRRDAASVFTAWTAVPTGQVPRAFHLLVGYQRALGGGWQLATDLYYKSMKNLFIAEWTARPRLTTRLQQASGRVLGLDTRAEFRRNWLYAHVNYGLATVEYKAMQPELIEWFGSAEYTFRPAHDRRHQINMFLATDYRGYALTLSWQFGSGRPFNRALGFDGFILMDGSADVFTEPGERRVIYERPFNGILPTYHRLDVSLERTFVMGTSRVTAQASVINVYDRANIFYLDVFTLQRADQLPIIPALGLKVDIN